jgi:hypothetical protein
MPHTKKRRLPGRPSRRFVFFSIFLSVMVCSCRPFRLVQSADDVTERRLISLQEKFSRFFIRLERQVGKPESSLVKYTDFYEDIRTDLAVLQIRNRALDKSEIVRDQLDLLDKEVGELESLHGGGFQDVREVWVLRETIEETMVAMFKWQFTLKNRWK